MSFVLTKKGKKYFDIKNSIAELNWVHDDIDILAERIFNIIFSYPDCVRIGVAMTCIFILLTGFDDDV
ncbi:hypothetical protein, partial [Xenorhabdus bovienii]|uniref:hypothetical protein n=1 Tax=Xenorhabdus bovienii TaxID=40576 RepID=UPI0023B25354